MPFSLFSNFSMKLLLPFLAFQISLTHAQASINKRAIGAVTPLSSKSKVCSVLDYGAVADGRTDLGPAITKTFTSCVSGNAATLLIPEGDYSMATGVKLNKGSGWAFQIDGQITLTTDGSFNGNAIVIQNAQDVEVFSSNNKGAINGQGYVARRDSTGQNARLMRFISSTDVSVHNLILVDSPTFHLVFNNVANLDMFYITVRGPDIGGTDGIDLICDDNCHLHDFEVTNRDECVSVKSPSSNVLIENAYCNHSGGMSIGSLTADGVTDPSTAAAVSNITMQNIYVYKNTQMLMIKTFPGGSGAVGYVKDSLFQNFWAYDTTYALDIDQYWESHTTPNTGAVALSGLTFKNWQGTMDNGASRGAIVIRGSDIVPVQDITLEDFNMWTVNGNKVVNVCKNVYGTGYCAASGSGSATFTTSVTSTTPPAGFTSPTSPTWAVEGYGTTDPIPVYTPAVMWPAASSNVATSSAAPTRAASNSNSSSAAALTPSATLSLPSATSVSSAIAVISSAASDSISTALLAATPSPPIAGIPIGSGSVPSPSSNSTKTKRPCHTAPASPSGSIIPILTNATSALNATNTTATDPIVSAIANLTDPNTPPASPADASSIVSAIQSLTSGSASALPSGMMTSVLSGSAAAAVPTGDAVSSVVVGTGAGSGTQKATFEELLDLITELLGLFGQVFGKGQ
ncbi:MAG: hypothetical protein Q9160_000136 [Pyrenula sp. 1 TL-2023]